MATHDTFDDLARYYDPIMGEIDYDRWQVVTMLIADLLGNERIAHVDLACGTGTLIKRLIQHGWESVGLDLSTAMLKQASRGPYSGKLIAGDLRALPLASRFNYATCIFDSLNFLLDPGDLDRTIQSVGDILVPGGIFYFDVITEKMVTKHFADREWQEDNGRFSSSWKGSFDRKTAIAELQIRVNTGPLTTVRERVHSREEIRKALSEAGLTLLGEFDSESWKDPSAKTTRIDVVAVKSDTQTFRAAFEDIRERVRLLLA